MANLSIVQYLDIIFSMLLSSLQANKTILPHCVQMFWEFHYLQETLDLYQLLLSQLVHQQQ